MQCKFFFFWGTEKEAILLYAFCGKKAWMKQQRDIGAGMGTHEWIVERKECFTAFF